MVQFHKLIGRMCSPLLGPRDRLIRQACLAETLAAALSERSQGPLVPQASFSQELVIAHSILLYSSLGSLNSTDQKVLGLRL